jgi:hypothetical protein
VDGRFDFFAVSCDEGDGGGGGSECGDDGGQGCCFVGCKGTVFWESFDTLAEFVDRVEEVFGGDVFETFEEDSIEIALLGFEAPTDDFEEGEVLLVIEAVFGDGTDGIGDVAREDAVNDNYNSPLATAGIPHGT